MLRPRTNHTSATLNGEVYVIGGRERKNILLRVLGIKPVEKWTADGELGWFDLVFTVLNFVIPKQLISQNWSKYSF